MKHRTKDVGVGNGGATGGDQVTKAATAGGPDTKPAGALGRLGLTAATIDPTNALNGMDLTLSVLFAGRTPFEVVVERLVALKVSERVDGDAIAFVDDVAKDNRTSPRLGDLIAQRARVEQDAKDAVGRLEKELEALTSGNDTEERTGIKREIERQQEELETFTATTAATLLRIREIEEVIALEEDVDAMTARRDRLKGEEDAVEGRVAALRREIEDTTKEADAAEEETAKLEERVEKTTQRIALLDALDLVHGLLTEEEILLRDGALVPVGRASVGGVELTIANKPETDHSEVIVTIERATDGRAYAQLITMAGAFTTKVALVKGQTHDAEPFTIEVGEIAKVTPKLKANILLNDTARRNAIKQLTAGKTNEGDRISALRETASRLIAQIAEKNIEIEQLSTGRRTELETLDGDIDETVRIKEGNRTSMDAARKLNGVADKLKEDAKARIADLTTQLTNLPETIKERIAEAKRTATQTVEEMAEQMALEIENLRQSVVDGVAAYVDQVLGARAKEIARALGVEVTEETPLEVAEVAPEVAGVGGHSDGE